MQITATQLEQVNKQIQALVSAESFYGKKLEDAGISGVSSPEDFTKLHFSEKKAMALLYKLEQHTVELVKLSRQIVELSREMEAKWSQKSV